MSAAGFAPKYEHPFTLEQAILLEIDILIAEIARLENSINHLRSTQTELQAFIQEDPANDDDGELSKAVAENEETMASQTERINLIKVALLNKVGEGGVKHYGLELPSMDPPTASNTILPPDDPTFSDDQNMSSGSPPPGEDQGLHL